MHKQIFWGIITKEKKKIATIKTLYSNINCIAIFPTKKDAKSILNNNTTHKIVKLKINLITINK